VSGILTTYHEWIFSRYSLLDEFLACYNLATSPSFTSLSVLDNTRFFQISKSKFRIYSGNQVNREELR
jgi:hypothetical protein